MPYSDPTGKTPKQLEQELRAVYAEHLEYAAENFYHMVQELARDPFLQPAQSSYCVPCSRPRRSAARHIGNRPRQWDDQPRNDRRRHGCARPYHVAEPLQTGPDCRSKREACHADRRRKPAAVLRHTSGASHRGLRPASR